MSVSDGTNWILGELTKVYRLFTLSQTINNRRLSALEGANKCNEEQAAQIKILAEQTLAMMKRVTELEALLQMERMDKQDMN